MNMPLNNHLRNCTIVTIVVQGKRVNLPISVVADHIPWWRHQMETFSALLALCAGNSPVPVNSPHKGQWRGALMFSLMWAWINDWVNNREAGDLRRYRGHYDVSVMLIHRTRGCFVHLESYICHLTGSCGKAAQSVWKLAITIMKYEYMQRDYLQICMPII